MKISLKAARVNANLTLKEASEAVGMAEWTLRRYEHGGANWKYGTILKLCKLYQIQVEDLKNEEENHSSTKSDVEYPEGGVPSRHRAKKSCVTTRGK